MHLNEHKIISYRPFQRPVFQVVLGSVTIRTLTIRPSDCRAEAKRNALLFKLLKKSILNLLTC